jgi:hypothetical protein
VAAAPPRAAASRIVRRAPARAGPSAAARKGPGGPALNYNTRAVIVAATLAALLLANTTLISGYGDFLSQFSPCTVNQRSFPRTAEFNVTRNFGISSPGGDITYHLSLAQPYDIQGQQDLLDVTMSPVPNDSNGRLWWNRSLPRGAHESVSITYALRMTTTLYELKNEDVGTTADVPANLRAVYLDEEWKINPNSPTVQRLADQVTDSSKPYLQQLKDLYKYLLCPPYHYLAGGSFEPQSPEQLVASQAGDCDDFSVLFISMARYLGIPAWLELGLLYDELRGEWGPHGWATVYIPLKSGGGITATVDVVNKLFLIRDPYHFSDWSADGDADHLRSYYTLLTYAPATTPPLQLSSTIPPVQFRTEGVVNYFSP